MNLQSITASAGYHPTSSTVDIKALEESYEKLKLENLNYKQRCEQLQRLCRGMYEVLELVGKPYDPEKINRYLDEDGFAQMRECMATLGLLEGEQE